jgi:dTDP-4-dehydrorhamnose 3,5-epimerase
MNVENLSIPDVKLIKPRRFNDNRGFFQQTYHYDQYAAAGITARFVQDNWSRSSKGVLRGLHYQLEHPQAKLVSVLRGEVFDVAVDLRKDSEHFGRWVGAVLSEQNGHQLFVPEGFAHGFLVLSETVDFVYKCSDFYTQGDEYGVIWNDPAIGIEWPTGGDFLVSDKDQEQPKLASAKVFQAGS